ncbi:MAG TPA: serine/threonine-protein kinase [Candidatus Acidoferrum sp.]|nr:serine/threonine-protein kinase [Candidatus Acidoferrum sp.]
METATKPGRYEVLGELGRGAMGVVYRAKDPLIGRTVAVKTIRLSEEGTGLSHAQLVERFQTEARAAGLLTHPNIVVIYDAGETDGLYYITMELLNGKSLQSLIDSGEKFPFPRLLRITEQVCSALQYAHDHKVVHRDIKPANVMVSADDLVKITDFGTAKILQYGASQQTGTAGTPAYMSPEQVKGKVVDGRTDIFSLGVMLYEITTGQKPFQGQDIATILYRILSEEPVPPHQRNPSIPPGVSSAIMKALAKSPHLRYENCRELLEDLKNYRPGESLATVSAPAISDAPQRAPAREKVDRNYYVEMPRIPGVAPRSASPAGKRTPPPPEPAPDPQVPEPPQAGGVYAGPTTKANPVIMKRVASVAAAIVGLAMLASWGVKMLGSSHRSDSYGQPVRQAAPVSPQVQTEAIDPAPKPLFISQSNPEVAAVAELAQPWSSKKFFFRNLATSRNVPALIVRLPGPASQSKSYWAFSLEAPFNQCQFAYVEDLSRLSSEYSFAAEHPMVVNPCTHTVFDPLQLKELPGNILVRGAIVEGYDSRPPLGIEVKVSENQVLAIAME